MKKLLFLFLVLCSVQSYGQTRLTPMETKDLFVKTNNMFTEFYTDIIDCMFVFDQTKYDQALENLKLVILNYDIIGFVVFLYCYWKKIILSVNNNVSFPFYRIDISFFF